MKRISATFVILGLVVLSAPSFYISAANEEPVKCAMLNFKNAYKRAAAVFVGKVVSVKKEGDIKITKFKVSKFWKGVNTKYVVVRVFESRRFQSPYRDGRSYLVFAKKREKGGLWDGRCSRSRDVEGFSPSLKKDLKALGEGKTCISLVERSKNPAK